MSMLRRLTSALLVVAVCAFGATATSCSGSGGGTQDLVLVSFNLPNIAGIPLNQTLIFTFSADVDPSSITPDTLRVVGAIGPFFETIVVDGNLVALIPQSPNFEDYSDAGMAPATSYSVSLSVFPATSTIRSTQGRPLLSASSYTFVTLPFVSFIEPRRPFHHGLPPSGGGRSDDEGCLQNWDNSLYVPPQAGVQFGSLPGGRLLCLENEGSPRVILDQCIPTHDQIDIGTPNASLPGYIDLPAIRIRVNEPLDPLTVTPITSANLGVNVQLWRVGDTDGNPLPGNPEAIETNTPVTVQSLVQSEIVLGASAAVLQGTYLINIRPAVSDLPGFALSTADRPPLAGSPYAAMESWFGNKIPPGYRIYFVTLKIPSTPQAFNESFGNNLGEWGDNSSGTSEPGIFTESIIPTDPLSQLPGAVLPAPELTLLNSPVQIGQSTDANWNGQFRFLNLPGVDANADADTGVGRLKATFRPYTGDGQDGVLDTTLPPYTAGAEEVTLSTDAVPGASINGDGIYEYERVRIGPGDTLRAVGANPLIILCRGDMVIDGLVQLSGQNGGPGLDTDGSDLYTNSGAALSYGVGGAGGPGGGAGGTGGDAFGLANGGAGASGASPRRIEVKAGTPEGFEAFPFLTTGGGGAAAHDTNTGGGGGSFGDPGSEGFDAAGTGGGNAGATFGDARFARPIAHFEPDRGYFPHALVSGGAGGGGGGVEDDDGASEAASGNRGNGDDGGAGGGGAGGGLWIITGGSFSLSGTILAQGGNGGDTFNQANQQIDIGPDATAGTDDDVVIGLINGAVPSGQGAPGGAGSGGSVAICSRGNLTVTGVIGTLGGAGGRSGDPERDGGFGGGGRVLLVCQSPSVVDTSNAVDISAASLVTGADWAPTVDLASSGQSQWFDLSSPTADFDQPFHTNNFAFLGTEGLTQGVDFDAVLEFQGADTLTPVPGGAVAPSAATGLTDWSADWNSIDLKRYIRWRVRFFVAATYPAHGVAAKPMPSMLDLTVPFQR